MNTILRISVAAALIGAAVPAARARAQAPAVDPHWLVVDSAATQATLTVVAGMGGANGGMNFDGAINGALTFTVPAGWHVTLRFRNADQMQPHSLVVVPAANPVPANPGRPAFAGATTHRVVQGMPPDSHEDVSFTADRAGDFMLFCGVPGHGLAGMWLRMRVDPAAPGAKPALVSTPK